MLERIPVSSLFALFLLTSFANIATPGLGVTMIVVIAAQFGWKKTLGACLGTALGIAVLFLIGVSGLGVIVATSPVLFAGIKTAGALFLFWLAWKTWQKPPVKIVTNHSEKPSDNTPATADVPGAALFWKCFVISLTNPQPIVFCLSLFPQFIDPTLSYWPQVLLMIASYAGIVFVMMVIYALMADRARRFLAKGRGPRLINRTSAVVFAAIGLYVLTNAVTGLAELL